jgi:hypothetical protein
MLGFCPERNNVFNFGDAPFFVSPARHGEAQDMSGDLQKNGTKPKVSINTNRWTLHAQNKHTSSPLLLVLVLSHSSVSQLLYI